MAARISWDIGTAYDLFISLHVLHQPNDFSLRAAWAAGMRSRLPSAEREFLENAVASALGGPPLAWLYRLPQPKDATTALDVLAEIPASQRINALALDPAGKEEPVHNILNDVARRGDWTEADRETLRSTMQELWGKKMLHDKHINGLLHWWSRSEEFGEKLLSALQAYYEVFFAEEERRIRPYLDTAVARAQGLAGTMPIPQLVETLSQGVRFTEMPSVEEFVFAPSYWGTPLMFFHEVEPNKEIIVFGARPAEASLVPGETVPDALVNGLKALSDPTRLRILRYLTAEPLTPTQLARRLRLRAPTVIHHLQMLRAAGLVYVMVSDSKEKMYQSRAEGIMAVCGILDEFMSSPEGDAE